MPAAFGCCRAVWVSALRKGKSHMEVWRVGGLRTRRMKIETTTEKEDKWQNYCCLRTAGKHEHMGRDTHLAHGGSSPSRYNSCFEPRRSGSPRTGGAWTALHTDGHCSFDSAQWLPYKTPHRGWEDNGKKRKRKEGITLKEMFHLLSLCSHADPVLVTGSSRWAALTGHAQHHRHLHRWDFD